MNMNSSGSLYRFKKIKKHWQLYVLLSIPLLHIVLFRYVPMVGVQIAFKDYNVIHGIWGSHWAGLKYFKQFILSPNFFTLLKNTLAISLSALIFGFPIPILLALLLNEIGSSKFKKMMQTVTMAPYFISTVVMVSMILLFLSSDVGMINKIMGLFGMDSVDFMAHPGFFKFIYSLSGVWQGAGYGAVIYFAALSGINPELYESARVDGASRIQKIINIDLPGIMPTIIIVLIVSAGQIMGLGYEKVFLMQNTLNLESSEVISTYVYKVGLVGANFSFSAAIGLFNSIVNLILLLIVNQAAKKMSETSLW